jgi:hypothetical protein
MFVNGLQINLLDQDANVVRRTKMPRPVRKWIVRLRMWYADLRGHHGKRWDYEPARKYMGRKK